jgi:ATP-binding cassette subfamily B protein
MKKIFKVLDPFFWAIGISWKANWRLFSVTSFSNFITTSVSGIINTFLVAQTTASVALLATNQVTIRTPVIWSIAFGVFNILTDLIRRLTNYYETKFIEQLDVVVSQTYINKVSSFTQEQLDDPNLQTSLSMAGRELYAVRNGANTLQEILSSFSAYLLAVIVVWQYAWGIGLLLLVLIPILAISNYFQTKRRRISYEASTIHWRIASGLFNYLTDPLRLFQIKIMSAREKIMKLRDFHAREEINIRLVAERKNTLYALLEDIASPIIEVGTRIWAIVLVAGGKLAFDQFLFVIGLIQQASTQTFALGYNISNAQQTYLAISALRNVMSIPDAVDGEKELANLEKGVGIRLDNVGLKYHDGTTALNNINMEIKAGQKVAIVGENGAGKTSLLRLLTRQYEPTTGTVWLQGLKSTDIKRSSLYDNISILSQDYYLFEDLTIRQNLEVSSRGKVSKEAIDKVLKIVNMHKKINSMDKKLDTRLDKSYEDGSDLSGGQRQRLSIARALLKPYKLLILDEPTSAIDAKAEMNIFTNILEKSKNATMLIVSHRFSTVRKADYIYVVDKGEIIEQGSHAELMAQKGHYAELYDLQVQDFLK